MKRPLLAGLLAAVLAVPAVASVTIITIIGLPAPPLVETGGRLLSAPQSLAAGDETLGSFSLASGSAEDLRLAPGTAALETFDGRVAGAAVRVNEARNVDPGTGRPRQPGATGPCDTGAEPDCLTPLDAWNVNFTAYDDLCASSILLSGVFPAPCATTSFLDQSNTLTGQPAFNPIFEPTVAAFGANVIAGNDTAGVVLDLLAVGLSDFLVPLNVDPCDGFLSDCLTPAGGPGQVDESNAFFAQAGFPTLNDVLTPAQKALFGCGELMFINCELVGIPFELTEAGALLRAFVAGDADAADASVAQPGTLGTLADGCKRTLGELGVTLAGCRGPGDLGFDANVDGTQEGLLHPLTDQAFSSEVAAASWNLLMLLVGTSLPFTGEPGLDEVDPAQLLRTDGCSVARPGLCREVANLASLSALHPEEDPRGEPRQRWFWESGAQYAIDEASEGAASLQGGRLHAVGPEDATDGSGEVQARFVAVPPDGTPPPGPTPFLVSFGFSFRGVGTGVLAECSNGRDDDGDGLGDADDLGCPDPLGSVEDPACDDGEDNDGDGLTDLDDPGCFENLYSEGSACGLGAELALVLLPLAGWHRRRRRS